MVLRSAACRAIVHRLLYDDTQTAMTKTLSFSARANELVEMVKLLEGYIRTEVAELDETATFAGRGDERYTLVFALAPESEAPSPEE